MRPVAVHAGETGLAITAEVHEELEQRKALYSKHDGGGEGGGVRGDVGVDVGAMVQQELHGAQAAVADGHEKGADDVAVGVGTRQQQQLGGVHVVVDHGEVESRTPAVLVEARALGRQRRVHVEARGQQHLQHSVVVALGRQVQRANAAAAHSRAAGHGQQHLHNPVGTAGHTRVRRLHACAWPGQQRAPRGQPCSVGLF